KWLGNVPEFKIPKKEVINLYPESDKSAIDVMKSHLAETYETEEIKFIKNANNPNYIFYKGSQSGSNPGCWGIDAKTGELYYFKTGNGKQNITEHVSAILYKAAGIEVPETSLINPSVAQCGVLNPQEILLKSKAIANLKGISSNPQKAYEGFAVDAWLANWDAVCSGNTLLKGNTAVRIDFGGCLKYRARGGSKAYSFEVPELSSLLNPKINPESANLFKNMTREDLINSLKRVQSVTNKDIEQVYLSTYQYIEPDIFVNISMRKSYLAFILKEAEKTQQKSNLILINMYKEK
ncbi:MAG: hypothetical protein MJ231_06745, partial [bacterium]|nr:hypothetical protein [bacterium]